MPVQVVLTKENRVVLQTFSDPVSNADMLQVKTKMEHEILPGSTQKLHIIADFSAVWNLPGTILTSGSNMLSRAHPNTGSIICVTQNGFIRAMARVLVTLSPKHSFKIVHSLDEAYAEVDRLLTQES